MSTIASLVATLGLDEAPFVQGTARVAESVSQLANRVNAPIQEIAGKVEETKGAFRQADDSAKTWLKTLLKIGGVGATLGVGIKAAYEADKAARELSRAIKGGASLPGPSPGLADAYDHVTASVSQMYEAFGKAFSASAGLPDVLEQISNITQNLSPAFETLGSVLGTVASLFSTSAPLGLALVAAMKVFTITTLAAAAAGIWLLKSFILGRIIYALTGMTKGAILFKGAMLGARAAIVVWNAVIGLAQALLSGLSLRMVAAAAVTAIKTVVLYAYSVAAGVATGATAVLSAAMALLAAITLPAWIAIGVIVGVVAGALYGLYKVWQWFTKPPAGVAKTAADAKKLAKETKEAWKEVEKLEDALDADLKTAGMDDQAKKLAEYKEKLEAVSGISDEVKESRLRDFQAAQKQIEAAENHAKVLEELKKLGIEAGQAGMSENAKKLDDLRQLKASVEELASAELLLAEIEQSKKEMEAKKEAAKQLADIEKEAAQAGLTANQKRIDDLRRLGIEAGKIAELQSKFDAAEKKKELAEQLKDLAKEAADLERDAAYVGLTAAQKKLAILKESGLLQGEALAKAEKDAAKIDAFEQTKKNAEQAKQLIEGLATPLEKFQKRADEINRLRNAKSLDDAQAAQALAEANKEFREATVKGDSFKLESPKALLKDSADTALAADRQKSPLELLTQVQKDQLAKQEQIRKLAEQQLIEAKKYKPLPQVASF